MTYDIPGYQCPLCKAIQGHFMGCPCAKPPLNNGPEIKFNKKEFQKWLDEHPEIIEQFKSMKP